MILDLLAVAYPWTKSLHIISVVAWMAGLFYLPRLFVYHVERSNQGDLLDETFQVMEYKLLRFIMGPASVATWVFGICLALTPGIVDWGAVWPYTKALGVIAMTWFHHWLMKERRTLASGVMKRSGRHYRMLNEIPTILFVLIVISVVVKF